MLRRLWIVLSLGWASLMLVGQWNEQTQDFEHWTLAFAMALAPFAAIPTAAWIWAGRKRAASAK